MLVSCYQLWSHKLRINVEINVTQILQGYCHYDCYSLLLDVSKAFDHVEYQRLFRTLRDRNMCLTVVHLLINMYVKQSFQVR